MMIQAFSQKTEYMICVACGRRFIPSFRHPHQKYCKHPQCIRDRNVLRQRKSTQQHRKDRTHRLKTSRRKHKEYLRRKERKSQRPPPERAETWHDPVTPRNLDLYFLGLISYATGTTNATDLSRLRSRCYEIGKNICLRR